MADPKNPGLKGSYKLPKAPVVGDKMVPKTVIRGEKPDSGGKWQTGRSG